MLANPLSLLSSRNVILISVIFKALPLPVEPEPLPYHDLDDDSSLILTPQALGLTSWTKYPA